METLQRSICVAFLTADLMCHEFSRPNILAISVLILVFLSFHFTFQRCQIFVGQKRFYYRGCDDDDEFRFKDASTHEGHLHQNVYFLVL